MVEIGDIVRFRGLDEALGSQVLMKVEDIWIVQDRNMNIRYARVSFLNGIDENNEQDLMQVSYYSLILVSKST